MVESDKTRFPDRLKREFVCDECGKVVQLVYAKNHLERCPESQPTEADDVCLIPLK